MQRVRNLTPNVPQGLIFFIDVMKCRLKMMRYGWLVLRYMVKFIETLPTV